jgi:hypothetical protein
MKILDVPQSGSLAGQTSSRNRYGQYRRTRATPVNPSSPAQQEARTRLQENSAAWRNLTVEQRTGWASLGASMTRQDSLGQTYTLTGLQAYASVNGNNLAAGNAVVADAPSLATPDPLTVGTITLTPAALTVAYSPTPLGADERVFVYASPQRSAGRAFEGDLRLIHVSAAAAASPANIASAYAARFGLPVEGNRIFFSISRYAGGFLSTPNVDSAVVGPAA